MNNCEILFKGKRKDNGEWVEGGICQTENWVSIFVVNDSCGNDFESPSSDVEEFEVIPETVGPYIGLNDKNGKYIFAGDIVTGYFNHEKITGYISYGSDAAFFIQREGLFGIGLNNASDWLSVIGNIHDNPNFKLIEGQNET